LGATMHSGIDLLLDAGKFKEKAAEADLVLTGEGSIDAQTLQGKVVSGVLKSCLKSDGPPVIAIGGVVDESARDALLAGGLMDAIAASPHSMAREEAMRNAYELVRRATAELMDRQFPINDRR
jgi:glycerate kinase